MEPKPTLYFDHNATSPLAPGVLEAMLPFLQGSYHNPSSATDSANDVRQSIEHARRQVAQLLGAQKPSQVIFTSGGTESTHAAFDRACEREPSRRRVLHSQADHSASKGAAQACARYEVDSTALPVSADGRVQRDALLAALDDRSVALVSLIAGNNETGVLEDLDDLAEVVHGSGARLHLDAVQLAGKVQMRATEWGADWISLSGHKFGAPKGIGVLFERDSSETSSWLAGGGQEKGRRGGTENVPGIIGIGCAAEVARSHAEDPEFLKQWADLRDGLEQTILEAIPGAHIHGLGSPRVPNTSFLCLPGQPAQLLLPLLEAEGLVCSAGSACDASHWAPSPVLLAMGVEEDAASCSLRLSLGYGTTQEDIQSAAEILIRAYRLLTQVTP